MSTDYELLQELATLDEVTVLIPGSMDGDLGHVPQWCDLLIEIKRTDDGTLKPSWPINARLPLRRHDGELIVEALEEVLRPHRVDAQLAIWEELDEVVDRIQARVEKDKEPLKRDVGQARGLATALAYLQGVSLETIREESMVRYESRI